jgi:predicted nucleic acid-binding protein
VRFWDTSAIVPLVVAEVATPPVRKLVEADPGIVVWWGTRTEVVSALARQRRSGVLSAAQEAQARRIIHVLEAAWAEISPSQPVRGRAERLLGVHPLRAADAFQLAAALLWSRGHTTGRTFVCCDDRLRAAASQEGFEVAPD